jgi:hypothetical protein
MPEASYAKTLSTALLSSFLANFFEINSRRPPCFMTSSPVDMPLASACERETDRAF